MQQPIPVDPRDNWFRDATAEQKRAAVHVLLAVAAGDGRIAPEEKNLIAAACTRMGVSAFEVAEALVKGMPAEVEAPATRQDRMHLLTDAAAVMVADHRVDSRELAVLLMVGKSLGFTTDEVSSVAAGVTEAMRRQEQRASVLRRLLSD
ncbi:MAG: hypothetical protein U0572_01435 [Phycisphaerales bacterium]